MECLLLAGGYSTRLYPLTKNFPKPLLDIAGKPVINYIIEKIEKLKDISKTYIVTNNKFHQHFLDWKKNLNTRLKIEIINDGSNSEQDKLGAIGDIYFVINQKNIDDDLLIIGGDNLFEFDLNPFVGSFKKRNKDIVSLMEETNIEILKQRNSTKLDKHNRIIFFEEKPENPSSILSANCIYLYTRDTVNLFRKYIDEGNNPDQPGRFVQWLYSKKEVLGYINQGRIIDIGTHETLEEARKEFISSS